MNSLKKTDKTIYELINDEQNRQETTIDLIASENYSPQSVLDTGASVLTNKYAEGYPGKRYYAGCTFVDQVEQVAIDRCKDLFKAEHANVQPHAGSQANMAVFFSALQSGDTILGMSLAEGGHLTHGHKVNFSGTFYNSVPYFVNKETHELDYDEIERIAQECKPKIIVAGASAYSRIIDFERFAHIAKKVGAYFLADIAHIAGLIAADLHPSPVGHADFITSTTHKTLRGPRGGLIMCKKEYASSIDKAVMPGIQGGPLMQQIAGKAVAFGLALQPSFKEYQKQVIKNAQTMVTELQKLDYKIIAGGTDNHLFIIDLRNKNINGKQAELILDQAGITCSRSCIPFDPEKPWITSGIRFGTPAITTRGMKEPEIKTIVKLTDAILQKQETPEKVKEKVASLCSAFPIY